MVFGQEVHLRHAMAWDRMGWDGESWNSECTAFLLSFLLVWAWQCFFSSAFTTDASFHEILVIDLIDQIPIVLEIPA